MWFPQNLIQMLMTVVSLNAVAAIIRGVTGNADSLIFCAHFVLYKAVVACPILLPENRGKVVMQHCVLLNGFSKAFSLAHYVKLFERILTVRP